MFYFPVFLESPRRSDGKLSALFVVGRCFIMEDRGYLVAHPTLIDPKGHAPVEQQHITHKVRLLFFLSLFLLFLIAEVVRTVEKLLFVSDLKGIKSSVFHLGAFGSK